MPDADPILASNPLDTRISDERADALFDALAADARATEDLLRARGDLWKARAEEAERAAAFENKKVRSLSASVEEMRRELARAQESAASWERRYHAEHADWRTAMDVANLMERQRDEARAEATTASKSFLARTAERDRAMSDLAAAVLREREECAEKAEARKRAMLALGSGPMMKADPAYLQACDDIATGIRARGGEPTTTDAIRSRGGQ